MATRVYGPDAFTVGSDTELSAYNADWEQTGATTTIFCQASTDQLHAGNEAADNGDYRWNGQSLLEQKIIAGQLNPASAWASLLVREDANMNGYLVEWDAQSGAAILYRATGFTGGSGGSWTQLAQGGTVASDTVYNNAYLQALGTNPVEIEAGDDSNGVALTYSDSDAARHQSGQPGISMDNLSPWLDDIEVWDETPTPELKSHFKLDAAAFEEDALPSELDIRGWW